MNEEILKKMEGLGLVNVSIQEDRWHWEGASVEGTNCRLFVNIQHFKPEFVDFVDKPVWNCCISAVPENIPSEDQVDIKHCMSLGQEQEISSLDLFEYGRSVGLSECEQDNPDFVEFLKNELPIVEQTFGFLMDRKINAMGDTGWSRLKM